MKRRWIMKIKALLVEYTFPPLPEENVRAILRIAARCALEAAESFRE